MNSDEILDDVIFNDNEEGHPVKLVSVNRFILMSVLSIGLYGIWWMYRTWQFFKERNNLDIMPAARAFFAIFFLYGLFEKIQAYGRKNGLKTDYSSAGLFVLFLILNLSGNLPEPFSFLSFFAFFALVPPFKAFNEAVEADSLFKAEIVSKFTPGQIFLLVLGCFFWGLILIGLLMPEEFLVN